MILVTGTKRSGTSLWMQILINGGFPFIGNAYSGIWKESIGDANPKGFYESKLRHGINFQNNPNPENGVYLHPKPTVQHAVKIFVPGLLKTEFAFIHRVVGTIRPWNEYCSSIERLLRMEDEYMLSQPVKEGELSREVKSIIRRPNVHPAFVWWKDNFTLLSDTLTRKYAINLVAYDKLLEEPENVIPLVLEWCNQARAQDCFRGKEYTLDIGAAVATVEKGLRTQKSPQVEGHELPDSVLKVFEDLYGCFYQGGSRLTADFCEMLNKADEEIEILRAQNERQGKKQKILRLQDLGLSKAEILNVLQPKR